MSSPRSTLRRGGVAAAVLAIVALLAWQLPADPRALADGPAESRTQLADARQQRIEMIQELRAINARLAEIAALLKEQRRERSRGS